MDEKSQQIDRLLPRSSDVNDGTCPPLFQESDMLKRLKIAILGAVCLAGSVEVSQALNTQSWVSGAGTGTACTRANPCATLSVALAATDPGGVISVLDGALAVESVNIAKSITIRAEGSDGGITYLATSGGANISVFAGAADVVTLVGLQLNGGGLTLTSGAHLHIVNCRINNANDATNGILFSPNSASKLSVTDTIISNIATNTGGGIIIRPQSGGSAQVNLERVTVNGNAFGIAVDGSSSTAGINATIKDSMIGGNKQDGIIATSSNAPIGVAVINSASINNAIGIRSLGSNVTVRVKNSEIIGNGVGLSGGGALLSAGNNLVQANGSNGSFTGSVPLQ